MTTKKQKIFVGTHEIAGYYAGLKAGFSELGHPVTRLVVPAHKFQYDESSPLEKLVQAAHGKSFFHRNTFWERKLTKWLIKNHDIFIFGFMTSLDGLLTGQLNLEDLKRIKRANKKIVSVFHGSEVRPTWLNGQSLSRPHRSVVFRFAQQMDNLRTLEKYSDAIVSLPPMAPLQKKPYANYLSVGVPQRHIPAQIPRRSSEAYAKGRSRTVIAHAPSNPKIKGSALIEMAIDRLQKEGHLIDFHKLVNKKNSEVLDLLERADLLVDQVFSDSPMAHLAAEAASRGCPTVVCGNDLTRYKELIPEDDWPPTIIASPDLLYNKILWAIEHPKERLSIGSRAHRYVSERWTAKDVAKRLLLLAEGQAPSEWVIDPSQKKFWGGLGMSLDDRDTLLDALISRYGRKWLKRQANIPIPLPR